jgi:hypothetical protein
MNFSLRISSQYRLLFRQKLYDKFKIDDIRLPGLWREQWRSGLEPWWELGRGVSVDLGYALIVRKNLLVQAVLRSEMRSPLGSAKEIFPRTYIAAAILMVWPRG